ncbi:MAG TPA: hypothetical protein VFJ06_11575, partial [Halococcus sp.]|nr:hypothetical protein [Halococcus sp.]
MENASVREYDNLQRPLSDWRLAASLSFVAVAAGTILMQWTDHPLGPWAGIYDYYAEFWFLLLAATVGMVLAIRWFTIPWWTVAAFSFCYVLAAV